jgi:hypothetical protein
MLSSLLASTRRSPQCTTSGPPHPFSLLPDGTAAGEGTVAGGRNDALLPPRAGSNASPAPHVLDPPPILLRVAMEGSWEAGTQKRRTELWTGSLRTPSAVGASWSSAWPGSGCGVPELASVAGRCRCRRRRTSRRGSHDPRRWR